MLIFVSLNLNNTLGETVLVMSFCSLGHFCPTVLTISSVAGQGVAGGQGGVRMAFYGVGWRSNEHVFSIGRSGA